MVIFNEKEIKEINSIVSDIQKAIEIMKSPNCKIGARDRVTVLALLKANSLPLSTINFFKCKREHSDAIVSHFVTTKGIKRSRFSMNMQQFIYITDVEGEPARI
jgi:hypothetical protein